ncbi:hypothetical protein [Aminipila sp.]|uniref:hypothetical protein n=1 Tax=Aminipila sp. TaxID=2060095 RepID=UPI00289D6691|nr:hypothetical protein [Aminipila sp.]
MNIYIEEYKNIIMDLAKKWGGLENYEEIDSERIEQQFTVLHGEYLKFKDWANHLEKHKVQPSLDIIKDFLKRCKNKDKKESEYAIFKNYLPKATDKLDIIRYYFYPIILPSTYLPIKNETSRATKILEDRIEKIYPVLLYCFLEACENKIKIENSEGKNNKELELEDFVFMFSELALKNKVNLFIPNNFIDKLKRHKYDHIQDYVNMYTKCLYFCEFLLLDKRCNVTLCFNLFNELTGGLNLLLDPEYIHIFSSGITKEQIEEDIYRNKILKALSYPPQRGICFPETRWSLEEFVTKCKVAKYAVKTLENLDFKDGEDDEYESTLKTQLEIVDLLSMRLNTSEFLFVFNSLFKEVDRRKIVWSRCLFFKWDDEEYDDFEDDDEGKGDDNEDGHEEDDEDEDDEGHEEDYEDDDEDEYLTIKQQLEKEFTNSKTELNKFYLRGYTRLINSLKVLEAIGSEIFWIKRNVIDLEVLKKEILKGING